MLVSLSIILLVAAGFCLFQAHTEKKRDTVPKSKAKVLAKMSTGSID